jgi:predicted nicotinamide N-methyase
VVDVGCGSGLAAIAAALAGAAEVTASDVDPMCASAVALNAALNGVDVRFRHGALLDGAPEADLVLAGDVFYEAPTAEAVLAALEQAALGGAEVIVGDPGRSYFPAGRFDLLGEWEIATSTDIERADRMPARAWRLKA